MTCLLGCMALFTPRLTIALVVFFSDYIGNAYESNLVPLLGFFCLPVTTLAYAWGMHSSAPAPGESGSITGIRFAIVIVAVLIDVGVIGVGHTAWRRREKSFE